MDPLSFAASVAGLLATAGAAVKITNSIYQLARDIAGAQDEIEDFGHEVNSFAGIMQIAYSTLNKYKNDPQPHSQALRDMQKHGIFNDLVNDCKRVMKHIKEIKKIFHSMDSPIELWTKFMWVLRKRDVKALSPKIQSVKSSISIVMQILTLENAMNSKTPDEKEIRMLRQQLEIQFEVIEMLQAREVRVIENSNGSSENPPFASEPPKTHLDMNFLTNLGGSLITPKASTPYFFGASDLRGMRSPSSVAVPAPRRSPRPVRHVPREIVMQSSSHLPQHAASQSSLVHQWPVRASSNYEESVTGPRHESDQESSSYFESDTDSINDPGEDPTAITEQAQNDNAVPTDEENRALIEARGLSLPSLMNAQQIIYHRLHPGLTQFEGFIQTPKARINLFIHVDRSCPHNIMSSALAEALGLENLKKVAATRFVIVTNGSTHVSDSMVTFEWGRTRGDLRDSPIRVKCYVFDDDVKDIILGQGFIQQKRSHEFEKNGLR